MADKNSSGSGVGIFSLLGLLFIGLKLTGYIAWSWWLVLAPFWGPVAIIAALFIIFWLLKAIGEWEQRNG